MIRKSLLGFGIIGSATAGYMVYKHKTDEGFRRAIRYAAERVIDRLFEKLNGGLLS